MKYLKPIIYIVLGIASFLAGSYGMLTILRLISYITYKRKKRKGPAVWKKEVKR